MNKRFLISAISLLSLGTVTNFSSQKVSAASIVVRSKAFVYNSRGHRTSKYYLAVVIGQANII